MAREIKIGKIIARTLVALAVGAGFGVFWIAWLSLAAEMGQIWLQALALVLGPLAIAAGLTVGTMAYDRLWTKRRPTFLSLYLWPLAGSAFAAAMTRIGGTFLMLAAMLLLGAAALVVREITLIRYRRPS